MIYVTTMIISCQNVDLVRLFSELLLAAVAAFHTRCYRFWVTDLHV